MKKFLAVFDGFKMSKSTLDYAIGLQKLPMPTSLVYLLMKDTLITELDTPLFIANNK